VQFCIVTALKEPVSQSICVKLCPPVLRRQVQKLVSYRNLVRYYMAVLYRIRMIYDETERVLSIRSGYSFTVVYRCLRFQDFTALFGRPAPFVLFSNCINSRPFLLFVISKEGELAQDTNQEGIFSFGASGLS
jgi:hypothetical protein